MSNLCYSILLHRTILSPVTYPLRRQNVHFINSLVIEFLQMAKNDSFWTNIHPTNQPASKDNRIDIKTRANPISLRLQCSKNLSRVKFLHLIYLQNHFGWKDVTSENLIGGCHIHASWHAQLKTFEQKSFVLQRELQRKLGRLLLFWFKFNLNTKVI